MKGTYIPYRTIWLLVAVCAAMIVPFLFWGDALQEAAGRLIAQAEERRVWVALSLIALLAADIVLPIPSSLVSTACGLTLGFVGGTAASFIGMTLSVLGGYVIGWSASVPAEKLIGKNEVALLRRFQEKYGIWLLLIMRPVPVMAEASVLFSGISRYAFVRMLAVTAFGNLVVSAVYAAVGAWGGLNDSFFLAFLASIVLSGLLMCGMRIWRRSEGHRSVVRE